MPSTKMALSKVLSYSDSAVRSMAPVTMTCMTTKQKFEIENPKVVVLANGRLCCCRTSGMHEPTPIYMVSIYIVSAN